MWGAPTMPAGEERSLRLQRGLPIGMPSFRQRATPSFPFRSRNPPPSTFQHLSPIRSLLCAGCLAEIKGMTKQALLSEILRLPPRGTHRTPRGCLGRDRRDSRGRAHPRMACPGTRAAVIGPQPGVCFLGRGQGPAEGRRLALTVRFPRPSQKSLWGFAGLSSVAFRLPSTTAWIPILSISSLAFTRGALQVEGVVEREVSPRAS